MRVVGCGAIPRIGVLLVVATGCGGDKPTPAPTASGGGGGAGTAGTATLADAGASGHSTASGGTAGSAGSGGAPEGGGSPAGAGGGGGCQLLKAGETGMNGLSQVYTAKNAGNALSALGIDGDQAYFQADGQLFALPGTGGPAKALGAFYGDHALVRGGKVYAESALGQGPRKLFSAPLTDLATSTTLTDTIDDPYRLIADEASLYYDHRTSPAIYQVPANGGTPVALVPGANPRAMVSHSGYLYWLDSTTDKLERVPTTGGAREPLVDSGGGGPMVAADTALYWISTGQNSIMKWELGSTKTQVLSKASEPLGAFAAIAASNSTVYWVFGFECGQVRQVNADGTSEALFAMGTNSSEWIGLTDSALFVMGGIGSHAYRADR